MLRHRLVLVLLVLAACGCVRDEGDHEGTLRPYEPHVKQLRGLVHIAASEVMAPLMRQWLADFQRHHPALRVVLEPGSSPHAVEALTMGAADVIGVTRRLTAEEERQFANTFGYKPVGLAAALDAVIVVVHEDNPLPGLTLAQLTAIFAPAPSSSRPARWGDVGLSGDWTDAPLRRYGLDPAMATSQFFAEIALEGRPPRSDAGSFPDPARVVSAILLDRLGIGFTSLGYLRPGIRAVGLSKTGQDVFIRPSAQTVDDKQYPLSRLLYLYVNQPPRASLAPSIREFLTYVKSADAQQAVVQAHFYRLPAEHLLAPVGDGGRIDG